MGCFLRNKAGSTRQVRRTVRPVSEKTEDYLELVVSFGFSFIQQSCRYLGSKVREDLHFKDAEPCATNTTGICKLVTGQAQVPPRDLST